MWSAGLPHRRHPHFSRSTPTHKNDQEVMAAVKTSAVKIAVRGAAVMRAAVKMIVMQVGVQTMVE